MNDSPLAISRLASHAIEVAIAMGGVAPGEPSRLRRSFEAGRLAQMARFDTELLRTAMSLALTHPDIRHATSGAALLLESYHVALEHLAELHAEQHVEHQAV